MSCSRGIRIWCLGRKKQGLRIKLFPLFFGFLCGYGVFYCMVLSNILKHADYCIVSRPPNKVYDVEKPDEAFLLVAVLTTRQHLETRADAVYRTWGKKVPGTILFFIGHGAEPYTGHLPVVTLEGVQDTAFPPQRKSFAMIQYICNYFINDFEWFMRADDDLYVKPERLEIFLRTLNSSKALYLGSPGYGKGDELFKLGLKKNKAFCMGGPGVFFTSKTLQLLKHHIPDCMSHTATFHEDTELGRCVQLYAGIECSHAYDWSSMFYHNTNDIKGSYTHKLGEPEEKAITLHPVKQSPHMYRLYSHFASISIQQLRYRIDYLTNRIHRVNILINAKLNPEIKLNPSDQVRQRLGELDGWVIPEYDTGYELVSDDDITNTEWDLIINKRAVCALHGIRRGHLFDVKPYYKIQTSIEAEDRVKARLAVRKVSAQFSPISYQRLSHGKFMENIIFDEIPKRSLSFRTVQHFHDLEWTDSNQNLTSTIWILLTLYQQSHHLVNFLSMASQSAVEFKGTINLQIILFYDKSGDYMKSRKHLEPKDNYSHKLNINVIFIEKESQLKVRGLSSALDEVTDESLLLLMNVNVNFDEHFLMRVIRNTEYGKQVYFPIPFAQYDSNIVCDNTKDCGISVKNFDNMFGIWHQFGYGIVSIYKGDFLQVDGLMPLNSNITGVSTEDEYIYAKCVTSNLRVFRAIDPSLRQINNYTKCDNKSVKYDECVSLRNELSGSELSLVKNIYKLKIDH